MHACIRLEMVLSFFTHGASEEEHTVTIMTISLSKYNKKSKS